jgi:hypothetical protein
MVIYVLVLAAVFMHVSCISLFVHHSQLKEIEEQTAKIARWKAGDLPEGKDVHDIKQQVRAC